MWRRGGSDKGTQPNRRRDGYAGIHDGRHAFWHGRWQPHRRAAKDFTSCWPAKTCAHYLTVDDFTAAGVNGAATVSENNTNNEFYCVYAGRSSGTGGIEMDAFVYDDASDQDEGYDSLLPVDDVHDVTARIANAQAAEVGTVVSGGPRFAQIAVRSGNLSYGIGIPPTGDWQTQLVALANAFMSKVHTLASPTP